MNSNIDRLKRLRSCLSSKHHCFYLLDAAGCPADLYALFRQRLPHIPTDSWNERFAFGGLFVNGKPCAENREISAPCLVEYFEPAFEPDKADKYYPAWTKDYLVYEDADFLAVYKPAGLPSFPTRDQLRFNLRYILECEYGPNLHMPSRLDTSAQGLVLLSKSDRCHAKAQLLFENRRIEKVYLLRVAGSPDWTAKSLDAAIGKDKLHPILRKVDPENGKSAVTEFEVIKRFPASDLYPFESSLLRAKPQSGRTHQLRVHCEFLGHPIIGDDFYQGAEGFELHLLSFALRFKHPFLQRECAIELPSILQHDWAKTA